MARAIHGIEQELETLRNDQADVQKEKARLPTDPSAQQSLDSVNRLLNNVLDMQKIKIEEIRIQPWKFANWVINGSANVLSLSVQFDLDLETNSNFAFPWKSHC